MTPANVRLLTEPRVQPTCALVEASASLAEPVPVWVQASTVASYGDAGDGVLDEAAPAAQGPAQMAGVATAWEASVTGARTDRLVVLRTGIVLDRDTPALDRLLSLARWGSAAVSAPAGSGAAGSTSTTGWRSCDRRLTRRRGRP